MSVQKETWQNVTRGTAAVIKLDMRGMEYGEVVRAGGKVSLSPEERRLNQDRAATEKQDLFSNGMLSPVRLVDGSEDNTDIAANPNFMSESDISDLFGLTLPALRAKLADIESYALVLRIRETAELVDARKSQVAAVDARLEEFAPKNVVEVQSAPARGEAPKPFTPA